MEDRTARRLLGLDLGEKTIGLAVSDELGFTAQPLEVIRRTRSEKDPEQGLEQVLAVAARLQVGAFIVGLPRNMNGTFGPSAEACKTFAGRLGEKSGLPVYLVDERLTTVAANRALIEGNVSRARRRQLVDATAASLILQTYLDGRARTPGGVE
ncbi:MAG: Holliday junction resolvase RuvX [Symbiobacteriia bacterium]